MKLSILFTLMISFISLSATAGVGTSSGGGLGPVAFYSTCTGSLKKTSVSFSVRSTALPNFVDSVLVAQPSNVLLSHLRCVRGDDIAPGTPSAGNIAWICTEFTADNSKGISVVLMQGGFSGITTGQVFQAQKNSVQPRAIGNLICK
jgi:hypothetical protein